MYFGSRVKGPKPLIALGMMFVALSLAWPRYLPVGQGLDPDLVDGFRGVLAGIAIGLSLWAVRLAWTRRAER